VPLYKDLPLVTIVIPAYNSEKFILPTLQSIQLQSFQNFEVRVVGDGCTDFTEKIVASLNDSRFYWINLEHTMRSNATNHGMREARGRYIAHLEHDDLWFPCHLSKLIECLEENQADFVFSWVAAIGSQKTQDTLNPPFLNLSLRGGHTPPSTWLHRKDIIETCGPWRSDIKNLRHFPDTEFFLRLIHHRKKIVFCKSLSVLYFSSTDWRPHHSPKEFPQRKYVEALRKNPEELQRELLLDLALSYANRIPLQKKWPRWLVTLTQWYGHDRFPFLQILRWRFLRRRKKWLSLKKLKT
jgi:glycosyltransferase involved in cell wall biosynthesis